MRFQQLKNIDTAFRQVRLFTLVVITGSLLLCGYSLYKSYRMVTDMHARIYILANGKALEAYSAERKDNIPVEARDHIRSFHHYFFTLDPDEKAISSTINRALYFADGSAKRQYDNLKENGYFVNLISGNVNQTIAVDSIHLDLDQLPFYFRCYATQSIIRTTSVVKRQLITEGFLRQVSRSENNSHGFLIERWATILNKDVQVKVR